MVEIADADVMVVEMDEQGVIDETLQLAEVDEVDEVGDTMVDIEPIEYLLLGISVEIIQ